MEHLGRISGVETSTSEARNYQGRRGARFPDGAPIDERSLAHRRARRAGTDLAPPSTTSGHHLDIWV